MRNTVVVPPEFFAPRADSELPETSIKEQLSRIESIMADAARDDAKDVYEIKFNKGGKIKIPKDSDAEFEKVAKRVMGWKEGKEFPPFTLYLNGEEIGGG